MHNTEGAAAGEERVRRKGGFVTAGRWLWTASGALIAACAAPIGFAAAPAGNTLESLDHAVYLGGKVIVRLVFSRALEAPPAVIVSHHPAMHVALDFADTASALASPSVEIGQRGVRSIVVVRAGARTRVIIHLSTPLVHELELKGKELWITLTRPGRTSGAAGELRELAFEPGESGAGRIVIGLPQAAVPVAIRRQGSALILEFAGVALATRLEQRLDVQDFGTAVRAIETSRADGGVRVRIELARAAEFTAYQVEGRLLLSARP
jgi:type IV pilus assembly protein PilQ